MSTSNTPPTPEQVLARLDRGEPIGLTELELFRFGRDVGIEDAGTAQQDEVES